MYKIPQIICNKVLTIGPSYHFPKGGMSQVLNNYSKIYEKYNFISTSIPSNKLFNLAIFGFALIKFIYSIINKNIEIVHVHSASNISFYRKSIFIILAKLFRKKVIIHIHGGMFKSFYKKNKIYINKILNKCDKIITLSNEWEKFFSQNLNLNNVYIIPNIIEFPLEKDYSNTKIINFLFLGKINKEKGIFDLLDVIKKNQIYLGLKFHLYIGGNGEIKKLIDYIKINKLENLITYIGWVDGDKKQKYLKKADIYILPSYYEGLPISILEAMSYEMPIISTKVGGIPEIVNTENGILIAPGNQEELINAIKYFIENSYRIKEMGKISKKKSFPYLPDSVSNALTLLYQELL